MSQNKKILLVDDEPQMLEILKTLLVPRGYDVATASDGEEALERVKNETPDLMILDVTMPKMDGFKVCEILGKNEKYRNLPIIILSARDEMLDVKQGMDLGIISYITKPFKSDALLGIVKGLLWE